MIGIQNDCKNSCLEMGKIDSFSVTCDFCTYFGPQQSYFVEGYLDGSNRMLDSTSKKTSLK